MTNQVHSATHGETPELFGPRPARTVSRRVRTFFTILILIVFQLPLGRYLAPGKSLAAQIEGEVIFWALTLILILHILFIEGRSMSSIGLAPPTRKSFVFAALGALAMVAGMALIYIVLFPLIGASTNEAAMSTVKSLPVWFRVLLITRAAVFEEIYYRGFMIERLAEFTGLRWLATGISLIAFTFAHLSGWGWPHLIVAGFGGAVLSVLYLLRRDLVSNMIAHFLTDTVGFLLG